MITFTLFNLFVYQNVHTDNGTFLLVNPKNHCHFIKAKRNGKHIWFAFRRKFDTCDRDGYIIDVRFTTT